MLHATSWFLKIIFSSACWTLVEIPYWAGTSLWNACSSLYFVIANIPNAEERTQWDTLFTVFLFTQVSYIWRGIFYLLIFIVLFNRYISTTVDSIFQLLPLFILDTLFGLIVNQVLGAEQKQRKRGLFPSEFAAYWRLLCCSGVWNW